MSIFTRIIHPTRTYLGTDGVWVAKWGIYRYDLHFLPEYGEPKFMGRGGWSSLRQVRAAIAVYERNQTAQGGLK